jgi:SAM-dependent methyltransferase
MTTSPIDFGVAAGDYARHRAGFPDAFFDRVGRAGIGTPGQRVLDLGTGTGFLARGFAARGCCVVGLDPSPEMLREAVTLTRAADLRVHYVRAVAEATGLMDEAFDVVCAGQCWHWFDRARASREVARLLRARGCALIGYLTYLSDPGTLGAMTEALVLHHHPDWRFAGSDGRVPEFAADLAVQGLGGLETFEFDMGIIFSHDSWRGRFRTCNGVFTLPSEKRAAFDADLRALLATSCPDPVYVPHRVFGILARK